MNKKYKYGKRSKKRGVVLLELLITSSVAAILFSTVVTVYFNMTGTNTRIRARLTLSSEIAFMLDIVTSAVEENTLDWPEYYNYYVLNGGGEDFSNVPGEDTFGSNYTVYGTRFYNPGRDANDLAAQGINYGGLIVNGDDLGTWCQTNTGVARITSGDCDGLPSLELTEDYATGVNPYESSFFTLPTQASSVCDLTSEMFTQVSQSRRVECAGMSNMEKHEVSILFLISPDGNTKTMIGREPWYESPTQVEPSGYTLSILKMIGSDTDNDGVNETWQCAPGYLCTQDAPSATNAAVDPDADDLRDVSLSSGIYYDFIPISSRNISITDLRFYIGPLEDPNKAYNEFPEQTQPRLTVTMIAETLDPRAAIFTQKQRSKTVHMEVNTGFEGEINSYAP